MVTVCRTFYINSKSAFCVHCFRTILGVNNDYFLKQPKVILTHHLRTTKFSEIRYAIHTDNMFRDLQSHLQVPNVQFHYTVAVYKKFNTENLKMGL
jgi:hypothetical protein